MTEDGEIVTSEGGALCPLLKIPPGTKSFDISRTGIVRAFDKQGVSSEIGQIRLAKFQDANALQQSEKSSYWYAKNDGKPNKVGSPGSIGFGNLMHRYLEK